MKILIIRMWAEELNINSYNCQEIGLAKALVRKGNTCDIVLYTDGSYREEDFYFDGDKTIHIYYLKAKRFLKNCFYEKELYSIIKKYDYVQSAEYDQLANIKLSKILGNKLTIYHGPYKSSYTKRYPIKCLISDFVILFNPSYKKTKFIAKSPLAANLLCDKGFSNVKTIGVGLDTDKFNNIIINDSIQKIKNTKMDYKYILYVGKIEDRRNILFLLSVFKKLHLKHKVKLILVGKGEKSYVDMCLKYIVDNNLSDYVTYFESFKQDELPELYKCCDVFVLTSQYEIFGMVLLEALYFDLMVVTTLNGGSSTLKNENNISICKSKDFNEWYKKLSSILDEIKDKKNNAKSAHFKFNWANLVEKFIEVYKMRCDIYETKSKKK